MDEQVDILLPPDFKPSGEVKSREQSLNDGDWTGAFNLWIVAKLPLPSIVYQLRSPEVTWAPDKLDVAAGGHYRAGEKLLDGLREVDEELGRHFNPADVAYLGRKLYVGRDTTGRSKNNVIEVYTVEDDAPLTDYVLQKEEVYAVVSCPVTELLKVHQDDTYSFQAAGYKYDGSAFQKRVMKDAFPQN
jgi:hypothetical protein